MRSLTKMAQITYIGKGIRRFLFIRSTFCDLSQNQLEKSSVPSVSLQNCCVINRCSSIYTSALVSISFWQFSFKFLEYMSTKFTITKLFKIIFQFSFVLYFLIFPFFSHRHFVMDRKMVQCPKQGLRQRMLRQKRFDYVCIKVL